MSSLETAINQPASLILHPDIWRNWTDAEVRARIPGAQRAWVDLDTERPYHGWVLTFKNDKAMHDFANRGRVVVNWDPPHSRPNGILINALEAGASEDVHLITLLEIIRAGAGVITYPNGDDGCRKLHAGCLELEQQGIIERRGQGGYGGGEYVKWVAATE